MFSGREALRSARDIRFDGPATSLGGRGDGPAACGFGTRAWRDCRRQLRHSASETHRRGFRRGSGRRKALRALRVGRQCALAGVPFERGQAQCQSRQASGRLHRAETVTGRAQELAKGRAGPLRAGIDPIAPGSISDPPPFARAGAHTPMSLCGPPVGSRKRCERRGEGQSGGGSERAQRAGSRSRRARRKAKRCLGGAAE